MAMYTGPDEFAEAAGAVSPKRTSVARSLVGLNVLSQGTREPPLQQSRHRQHCTN